MSKILPDWVQCSATWGGYEANTKTAASRMTIIFNHYNTSNVSKHKEL